MDRNEQTFEVEREDSRSTQHEDTNHITIRVSSSYLNDNSNETSPPLIENVDEHVHKSKEEQ